MQFAGLMKVAIRNHSPFFLYLGWLSFPFDSPLNLAVTLICNVIFFCAFITGVYNRW